MKKILILVIGMILIASVASAWTVSNKGATISNKGAKVTTKTGVVLHFDGEDGSTTFSESYGSDIIFDAVGNVNLTTSEKVYGTASCYFDGIGDGVRGDGSQFFEFGTESFTIDFRVKFNSVPAAVINLYDQRNASDAGAYPVLYATTGKVLAYRTGGLLRISGTTVLQVGQWYHIALVRQTGVGIKIYLNGTQEGATYNDSAVSYSSVYDKPAIGAGYLFTTNGLVGYIDEFRIVRYAVWTSNFTPPTVPYTS